MEFFNLIEVIVKDVVDELFSREEDFKNIKHLRSDIIAYILNRIPPRYVTGERGIIHSRIDQKQTYQEHTDILFLAHEAIALFKKRRASETNGDENEKLTNLIPHMMGEALEETTLSVIPDLKITLLFKDKVAEMVDSSWKNPYIASKAIRGYFHFWPAYIEQDMKGNETVEFTLRFEHQSIETRTIKIKAAVNRNNDLGRTESLPLVLLKLKDGVSADFLSED